MDFTKKQLAVLQAFEKKGTLRLCDLPLGLGRNTMARLVGVGLVELVNPLVGMHSKHLAWRLTERGKFYASSDSKASSG